MTKMRETPVSGGRDYKPTPADVRRACEEIQATWSPFERAQRAAIRLSELVTAIDGEGADELPCDGSAPPRHVSTPLRAPESYRKNEESSCR